jgi:hypothetical protein
VSVAAKKKKAAVTKKLTSIRTNRTQAGFTG